MPWRKRFSGLDEITVALFVVFWWPQAQSSRKPHITHMEASRRCSFPCLLRPSLQCLSYLIMSQSRPVNDSALYRLVVLTAVRLLKHVRPHCGSVLFVSRGICIKYGHLINLSEASTMCFVSQHTSIPVPKIICAHSHVVIRHTLLWNEYLGR